ncbi:MAG: glycoside hydrolase family 3 C-terminal domain-containing protein [Bacteroidetes bacterium]|nr:glycoside hydrolase family 3 C-terminal domain-containing protein [Bacteroidota bacterium]
MFIFRRFKIRLFSLFLSVVAGSGFHATSAQGQFPFQDPSLPAGIRVADMLSRMTLQEKISQLGISAPAIDPLGIPRYDYWNEALHGVVAPGMTSFPQAIALSSTWDRDLIFRVATAISDEARAQNNLHGKGLIYWSPVINMARDPRWGRTEETYGEDPFLTGEIARNFIRGMQGNDPRYYKTVATVKHFACNNVENNREMISSNVDDRSLREYYLPAFRTCVTKAGVYSVMSAYNALNGVPCPVNRTLLTNILRDEWGFAGYVVSDCDAVADVYTAHGYVQSPLEATALSIKSGTDLNCGGYYQAMAGDAVSSGLMTLAEIDTALTRTFKARFLLGEFDPPAMVPYTLIPDSAIDCKEHRDLALRAAREAIVLLKNRDGVLPLPKDSILTIAVIGPNAGMVQLGEYSGTPTVLISPLQGIIDKFAGSGKVIRYSIGCLFSGPADPSSFGDAVSLAGNSDIAVVVCGTDLQLASEGKDRSSLALPAIQDSLVLAVFQANPKTVVVLVNGYPLAVNRMNDSVPGIISAWYDGQSQGSAIADVLFGDYNPGGKLTSTWYKSEDDIPAMDHYDIKENRTYQYFTGTPLFPFGYGLSYTTFDYSNLVVGSSILKPGDSLEVSATITNTGEIAGDEVPQCYVHHVSPGVKRPVKELRDFRRISLQPGESKVVTFSLSHEDLAFYDEISRTFIVEEGLMELMIGSSSEDIKLVGQVQVRGKMVASTYRQSAIAKIEAETFEKKSIPLTLVACSDSGQSVQYNVDEDYVEYRNVDFGAGVDQFDANMELDTAGGLQGSLEIRLDSSGGPLAGSMLLVAGTKENLYQNMSSTVTGCEGVHDVFLVFKKNGNGSCKINWFQFQKPEYIPESIKHGFHLFPNPASEGFWLAFTCTDTSAIKIEIFSIDGVMKKSFRQKPQSTGFNSCYFNTLGAGLQPGMYLVKCSINGYTESLKLCIMQK